MEQFAKLKENLITVSNLSYKPLGVEEKVLSNINLEVFKGDFVLLLGPSGCGKTTLTRCLNGLIPHLDQGTMEGNVQVKNKDTLSHEIHQFAEDIGMVFQNPDDQILSLKVVDEVAWGAENHGIPQEEIAERVDQAMKLLGIEDLKDRLTFAISGGQKQKVSIASNLAMLQDILVLDDPTTDLDPVCTGEVIETLAEIHRDLGKTLIVIEHDLNDLIELANRIVFMNDGTILFNGSVAKIISENYDQLLELGLNMPQHIEIAHAILGSENNETLPVQKQAVFNLLDSFIDGVNSVDTSESTPPNLGEPVLTVKDLNFSYVPGRPVLKNLNFQIRQGEFVAIIGANGSGKSTLVKNLIGLLHPSSGWVIINGLDTKEIEISDLVSEIGYVFQDPDQQLFANSVQEEILFGLKMRDQISEHSEKRAMEALKIVGLDRFLNRHPFSLSRGQRQKLAVATALLHSPPVILLDEPTTGQDRRSLQGLLDLLENLNKQGNTTIMITHDMDIVANYATRVMVMDQGRIVMDGPCEEVFYDHFDYLEFLNLKPPTVIDYCQRLKHKGMPRFLSVDSLVRFIKEVRESRKQNNQTGLAIYPPSKLSNERKV
jgi:energy-coupling factor transporter ATP-binding protein EcfA2